MEVPKKRRFGAAVRSSALWEGGNQQLRSLARCRLGLNFTGFWLKEGVKVFAAAEH